MAKKKKSAKTPSSELNPPTPQPQQFLGRQRLTFYACVILISGLSLHRFFQARVEEILGIFPDYRHTRLDIYLLFGFYLFTFGIFIAIQYFVFGDNVFRWESRQPRIPESEPCVFPSTSSVSGTETAQYQTSLCSSSNSDADVLKIQERSRQSSSRFSRNQQARSPQQEPTISSKELVKKIGSRQKKKTYRRCCLL